MEKNKHQYVELFEKIYQDVVLKEKHPMDSLKMLFEEFLNYIMKKEREEYLKVNPHDKGNGYYQRTLSLSFTQLNLRIPRVRLGGSWRPSLLPPAWKRANKEYENMLLAFLVNGYRVTQIKKALNSLGISFSKDALENVIDLIKEKLDAFKTQKLPSKWLAVFIDAYHTRMKTEKGTVKEISIYIAVGIDLAGYKHILGYWVHEGKESKSLWIEVLQNLITRGVTHVLMFLTDDFPGLTSVIKNMFPNSDHQLCFVHLRINLRHRLPKNLYSQVSRLLNRLKMAEDQEEGTALMEEIVNIVREHSTDWAKAISKKVYNYTAFLKYPSGIRRHIYTTNVVEGINSGLEKMRLELGGYFPSKDSLEANIFIQMVNLEDTWMRKPMPRVVENRYEINQMFNARYEVFNDDV